MGPAFHIFGATLRFGDDMTLSVTSLPNPNGAPFACAVDAEIVSEAERLASIAITGHVPFGNIDLKADFHYRIADDTLQPTRVRDTQPGARGVLLLASDDPDDAANPPIVDPALVAAGKDTPALGFVLRDFNNSLRTWISDADNSVKTIDLDMGGWNQTDYGFDIAAGRVGVRTEDVFVEVIDAFASLFEGEEIRRSQYGTVGSIRIDASGVHVLGVMDTGALMLHPDIFDTRALLTDGRGSPRDNALLYQYALVNGALDWSILRGPDRRSQIRWVPDPMDGSSDPGMVVFRYQDEHSNPVVLRPIPQGNAAANFRLGFREGLDHAVERDSSEQRWEKTNQGVVISGRASDDGDFDATVPCHLSAIDPVAVYGRIDDPDDPIERPRWLIDGRVPYSKRAPLELHGMITGARLRCKADFIADLWRQDAKGHDCSLRFTAVEDAGEAEFYLSELILAPARPWDLESQTEEREIYGKVSDTPPSLSISGRTAMATANAVVLPLIDTKFAFSNMTGVDRRHTETGQRMGKGRLFDKGREWADGLNAQFAGEAPDAYRRPKLDNYTHVTGFGAKPDSRGQPYATVIEMAPVTARGLQETGTQSVGMMASVAPPTASPPGALAVTMNSEAVSEFTFRTDYMFGGTRTENEIGNLGDALDKLTDGPGQIRDRFFKLWVDPSKLRGDAARGMEALRENLVGVRQFVTVDADDEEAVLQADLFYQDRQMALIEALSSGKPVPGIALDDNLFFAEYFSRLSPEQFGAYWRDEHGDPDGFDALWNFLWAPPSNELFRRALSMVFTELRAPGSDHSYDDGIKTYIDALKAEVLPFDVGAWADMFKGTLKGFLTDLEQGTDVLFAEAAREWKNLANDQIDALREEFGSELTEDVYRELLAHKEAADEFLEVLKEVNAVIQQYADKLEDLADLKTATRNYLFFTSKFETKQVSAAKRLLQARNTKFDLCRLGDSTNWFFLLDEDTTVVVKITRDRPFGEILREIEDEYRTPTRGNPLGVDLVGPLAEDETPASQLIKRLHPDVLQPDWVGVLLIAPTADIGEDKTLRDLAGLEHLKAGYIAIGGRRPKWTSGDRAISAPPIAVTANIFREDPAPRDGEKTTTTDGGWPGDTKLALVKLDVTIVDTKIDQGEIVFQLKLQNVLGRSYDKPDRDPEAPEIIFVRGDLPKVESKDKGGAPRSFEFSAWFDKAYKAEIDVAFLSRVELTGVSVGQHLGRTSINIDGALVLQEMEGVGPINLEFKDGKRNDRGKMELPVDLSDFRILLPLFKGGFKRDFGTFLPLDFNYPSIRFALPKPRAFNVFGVEFLPQRIGLIRGVGKEIRRLKGEYTWLSNLEFDGTNANIPFMELAVDFGKLPAFGGSNLSGLKFKMGLAVDWNLAQRTLRNVALGISGLEAKEIRIEFFRLMSLVFHDFRLDRFKSRSNPDDDSSPLIDVSGVTIGDLDFKVLDWEPFGEDEQLELMFLQPNDKTKQNNAVLAHFSSQDVGDNFFRLFWMLIGRNIDLKKDVLTRLLFDRGVNEPHKLLEDLITEDGGETIINAAITDQEEWLLGASFALGDILDECSFVFQDGRYYGIRLSAFWVEPIFQQRSIELAYIPGTAPNSDRFRTNLRLPFLDYLGVMRTGEFALEWAPNWDFLIDIGFPWSVGNGPDWFRSFAAGQGVECKIGWFIDKRTGLLPVRDDGGPRGRSLTISAGFGYYLGYYYGGGNSVAYIRAGIGIFAILQGSVTLENADGSNPFKGSIARLEVKGIVGIFAYGEGGINLWVLSASFRVAAVAAITCELIYVRHGPSTLTYRADLHAYYSASCRVGADGFKWTFRVSGRVGMGVSGSLLLN